MKSEIDLEDQVIGLPHRDDDVSDLWLEEAENRLAVYDTGKTSARDFDEVLDEVERRRK